MRARGTGLFENELAVAVRAEFDAALAFGASAYAAAQTILQNHAAQLNDPDDGPVVFFALASLQLDHGVITQMIRKRALTLINSGESIERWNRDGADIMEQRKAVEQELRRRLVALG